MPASAPATPEDLAALERAMAAAAEAKAKQREPVLEGPKRQHFLPRFYLEGFAKEGLLAVYDREKNEVRRQQSKDTTVITHFYTMEDVEGRRRYEIEALMAEYEGKAAPVIRKLAAKEPINADERSNLAIFLAFGAMRTPDIIESLKLMNAGLVMRMTKMMFARVDTVAERMRKDKQYADWPEDKLRAEAAYMVDLAQNDKLEVTTNHKWAVGMAVKMALEIAPVFAGRDWLVLFRDSEKKSFVTTDVPVVLTTLEPRETGFWGVGFGNADALVLFPLCESCVLALFGNSGDLRWAQADTAKMRHINLAMADRCQRFVVGRDEALVKSLAAFLGLAGKKWQPKMQPI